MLANLAAAALRAALRDKLHAGLNVAGLALGFAAAILIGLFVRDELSFDRTIPGVADIYRVQLTVSEPDRPPETLTSTTTAMRGEFTLDFPEFAAIARTANQSVGVKAGNVEAAERATAADPSFLETVPFPLIQGDPKTALARPDSVVLSQAMALKYFGRLDCVGETLEIDHAHPVTVTGVLASYTPSHFRLDLVVSGNTTWSRLAKLDAQPRPPQGDVDTEVETLVRLKPGTDPASFAGRFEAFVAHRYPPDPRQPFVSFRTWLRPLTELHLWTANPDTHEDNPVLVTLWAVAATGGLILLVAGINFVNLVTARSTRRALEVGVRKALGATRRQLVWHFMGESVGYALLALIFAVALVELVLPRFNGFLDRSITFAYWRDPVLLAVTVGAALLVGVAAGIYPAIVQSSFRPAETLKSRGGGTPGSGRLRQALVVLQFAVSIGLLISTATIYRQTRFATTDSLRFDRDQILAIDLDAMPTVMKAQMVLPDASLVRPLKARIAALPGVRAVTGSWMIMGSPNIDTEGVIGIDTPNRSLSTLNRVPVDWNFFEVYGMRPLAGRSLEEGRHDDSAPVLPKAGSGTAVVNEATVRLLGFASPQDAIGHHFLYIDEDPSKPGQVREIVGVMPDMQMRTVESRVPPTAFVAAPDWDQVLSVKLDGARAPETLAQIDEIWRELVPARPIERSFVDERIERLYRTITREGTIFAWFAGVAMTIGCLGLFGLSAFTAERRTKEIGIRKALGASTVDVVRLLVWQFTRPVLVANAIAWPIAGWLMHRWLEGFAYRIALGPSLFLEAGAGALAIAVATTAFHAIQVARARPVAALRYE